MIKNYYQILGLSPNCSKEEIKKAYRTYASKYHPDKQNSDKFFEERFKEIQEAYEILIDDNKRAQFDSKFNTSNDFSSNSNFNQNKSYNSTDDYFNELSRKADEKRKNEKKKRNNVYYTSKDLVLNGLYINYNGKSYELSDYDNSTIRKDDNSSFVGIGIIFIIIGIFTIAFFIGAFLLAFGIFGLFHKEYFVVLISKKGDIPLIKGNKYKMKKISRLINLAIEQNK